MVTALNNSIELKKLQGTQQAQTTTNTAQTDELGLKFIGKGEEGKAQNTEVFNNLDPEAQKIIQETIGNEEFLDPKKIAEALKAGGYNASTGKDGETFLEIKGKDGKTFRIWDIGSDGGIGTQDISFNGALEGVKNDIKTKAAGNDKTAAAAPTTGNNGIKVEQVGGGEKSESKSPDDVNTGVDIPELVKENNGDGSLIRSLLRNILASSGLTDVIKLEEKIDELLSGQKLV
ncbi:MAG: hypothetical protein A2Y25_05580 [Candidatus Melainabacteria bacterium GWF2_37_15]|nr:MAG: hypothetical protein A2Y25_05580 [Candidatus Melainabacteria bacterium GWF2_37_15]